MTDKKYYIAVQREIEKGKYYAQLVTVNNSDNLCAILHKAVAANICPTRAKAYDVVVKWTESFVANGTYAFDSPLF